MGSQVGFFSETVQQQDSCKCVSRSDKEISACNFLPQRWAARKNPSGKSKMLSSRYAETAQIQTEKQIGDSGKEQVEKLCHPHGVHRLSGTGAGT